MTEFNEGQYYYRLKQEPHQAIGIETWICCEMHANCEGMPCDLLFKPRDSKPFSTSSSELRLTLPDAQFLFRDMNQLTAYLYLVNRLEINDLNRLERFPTTSSPVNLQFVSTNDTGWRDMLEVARGVAVINNVREFMHEIAQAEYPELLSLTIETDCNVDEELLSIVAALPNLKYVSVLYTKPLSTQLQWAQGSTLNELSISNAELDSSLSEIVRETNIERLNAVNCRFKPSSFLPCVGPNLSTLTLDGSSFCDSDCEEIAGWPAIKALSCRGCGVTARGFQEILKLPELQFLNVSDLELGDESLLQLVEKSELLYLSAARTNLSPCGIQSLLEALPKLNIHL